MATRGRPVGSSEIDFESIAKSVLSTFANHGFDATTMTSLAEAAEVSRTSLNYHFGNKEALWKGAIDYLSDEFIKEFNTNKKKNKDLDGLELLKVVIKQIVHFNAKYPEFANIANTEISKGGERADYILYNLMIPTFDLTSAVFKKLRKEGKIKLISKQSQSSILLGMTNHIYANAYMVKKAFNIDVFQPDQIEDYTNSVIDIFFNGILIKN